MKYFCNPRSSYAEKAPVTNVRFGTMLHYNLQGKLSARMSAAGNLWQEIWDDAKPVPARRQKRLFDDTREAEKILQYLSTLRPSDFSQLLMPNFLHSAIIRILEESLDNIPDVDQIVQEAISKLSHATRLRCTAEVKHYTKIVKGNSQNTLK